MSFKSKLFIFFLLVILVVSGGTIVENRKTSLFDETAKTYKVGKNSEVDAAVKQAEEIYQQKKEEGVDFSSGPCLSEDFMANWVIDTVHNPRTSVDDNPANQCQAYLQGRAQHFVELDTEGNLVRIH